MSQNEIRLAIRLRDLPEGGDLREPCHVHCSAKARAHTNSQGRFLQIKSSNKTSIVFEVDQLEVWQREVSIAGFKREISDLAI